MTCIKTYFIMRDGKRKAALAGTGPGGQLSAVDSGESAGGDSCGGVKRQGGSLRRGKGGEQFSGASAELAGG